MNFAQIITAGQMSRLVYDSADDAFCQKAMLLLFHKTTPRKLASGMRLPLSHLPQQYEPIASHLALASQIADWKTAQGRQPIGNWRVRNFHRYRCDQWKKRPDSRSFSPKSKMRRNFAILGKRECRDRHIYRSQLISDFCIWPASPSICGKALSYFRHGCETPPKTSPFYHARMTALYHSEDQCRSAGFPCRSRICTPTKPRRQVNCRADTARLIRRNVAPSDRLGVDFSSVHNTWIKKGRKHGYG